MYNLCARLFSFVVWFGPLLHICFAVPSTGCGAKLPSWAKLGQTKQHSLEFNNLERTFEVHVPKSYDISSPTPLVVSFHGWGGSGKQDERDTGLSTLSETENFIVVYPDGADDNPNTGNWRSWNCAGSTSSPGPDGPTCIDWAKNSEYCYNSCKSRPNGCADQCDWTTCEPDIKFAKALYDMLEESFCIDTSREYATGMSNGGMFAYQVAVDFADRLAAVAAICGSFHRGFATAPATPVPLLDLHGNLDNVVPANKSLSSDGWYYTPVAEIFSLWKPINRCSGDPQHFPTAVDGFSDLYCVSEGKCDHNLVRCAFTGKHVYLGNNAAKHAVLVWDFLALHKKASHIGKGISHRPSSLVRNS